MTLVNHDNSQSMVPEGIRHSLDKAQAYTVGNSAADIGPPVMGTTTGRRCFIWRVLMGHGVLHICCWLTLHEIYYPSHSSKWGFNEAVVMLHGL